MKFKVPAFRKDPKKQGSPKGLGVIQKHATSNEKNAKKEKLNIGKKTRTADNGKQRFLLFGIRNKIFVCFLIPIIFMIIVGTTAYHYASVGMSSKFQESTEQTAKMAVDYMDMSCTYIQADAMEYAFDSDLETYSIGMLSKSAATEASFINDTKVSFMAAQSSNPFISNIHFITKEGHQVITTATTSKTDGFYDAYVEEMNTESASVQSPARWVDSHPLLDENIGITTDNYFISYQMQNSNKFAYIVIDMKEDAIKSVLEGIDFGDGSITGFVSSNGREVVNETIPEGAEATFSDTEPVFYGQSFYSESIASEDLVGSSNVTYNGKDYLYIYTKSEKSGLTFCTLIPVSIVTGQAQTIKNITITLVIIAAIIAFLIGTWITLGIQKNMKGISLKLNEVAEGNLTVEVTAAGNDELQSLARATTNMVLKNKKLVSKLSGTVEQLEASTVDVSAASSDIRNNSEEITRAIDEISEGMAKQAEHAEECVAKTNALSEKIKNINEMLENVQGVVDQNEKTINSGSDIVSSLAEKTKETSEITAKVGDSIEALKAESETINKFVDIINDISGQTNLLSLNASIEAARAGEAGKGFAVVAEEIRKLADDSAKAANEIKNTVGKISAQTMESVTFAGEAGQMAEVQEKAVREVIEVFSGMSEQMSVLFDQIKDITDNAQSTEKERNETLDAVESISAIIEETASESALVHDMSTNLLTSVDKLSDTAVALDENMNGVKTEISAFKVE